MMNRETIGLGLRLVVIAAVALCFSSPLFAQQKGQYVPGQFGLNAGVVPDPGFTYINLAVNYSADQLNNPQGNPFPNITGTYSFWADENVFMFVPKHKILGGYYAPFIIVNAATGSLVADFTPIQAAKLNAGGSGLSDTWVQPVGFGWHLGRADLLAGYGFVAPTGRFTPGASNNVGSGYWGHNLTSGVTVYLTKNKGTSANLSTDLEKHGTKSGTNVTPGGAFTMEWGLGQALPLDKSLHKILQLGVVGYDQWQVSNNSGTIGKFPASQIPFYSVHGVGVQSNFIMPKPGLVGFFKYYKEYKAKSRVEGRTIAIGFAWTWRIPKPDSHD